jgi:mRNA interferase HicA
MKKRELERKLISLGGRLARRGGRHDVWTNGLRFHYIPRHREINEKLALAILRAATESGPVAYS